MAFNRNDAYEVSDSGYLMEDGIWITSGAGIPSHAALLGDRYFRNDGSAWVFNGTIWVEGFNLSTGTEGTNNIFNGNPATVNSGAFEVLGFGSTSQATGTALFIVVAETTGNIDIRLFDEDNAIELAILNFTDNIPIRKAISFDLPGEEVILEVQGLRNTASGSLLMAEIRG